MKWSVLYGAILLCFLVACTSEAPAQPTSDSSNTSASESCEAIVDRALDTLDTVCDSIGRNQACYGNRLVEATLRNTNASFANPGDKVAIEDIQSLNLLPLDAAAGVYGFAALQLQANLPDTLPGQNVTFLLFGGTQFSPQGTVNGLEAYYVSTGIGSTNACNAAPNDGVLIQTPSGTDVAIQFTLNGVTFELGSTAFVRAEPEGNMQVALLEGQAVLSAEGESQTIPAGSQSTIALDAEGFADAPPSPPEPYTPSDIRALPIRTLPETFTPAEPADTTTQVATAVPGAVEAIATFSTLENPERGLQTGELTDVSQVDTITFEAQAGNTIFINSAGNDIGVHSLTLLAPDGTRIHRSDIYYSPGLLTLEQDGTYTIEIRSRDGDEVGMYNFNLWNVPAPTIEPITLTPPEPEPEIGLIEGEISTYGQHNLYTVDLEAGQRLFFDSISTDDTGRINWQFIAPDGTSIVSGDNYYDVGVFVAEQAGTYTIRIAPTSTNTGSYAFRLWDVPAIPEPIPISLTPPEPEPESGLIEGTIPTPGQQVRYSIDLEAGQRLFFDSISTDDNGRVNWVWITPDGTESAARDVYYDVGTFVAEQAGTYTIRITGSGDTVGSFSFRIWDVPAIPEAIEISLTPPEPEPETGLVEGEISTPGQSVLYSIDLEAGQRLLFDSISTDDTGRVNWVWLAPDGTESAARDVFYDVGVFVAEQAGTYTIRIGGQQDTTGSFSFRIWDVPPPTEATISIAPQGSDSEVGVVTGEIATPGQANIYTFEASEGEQVMFESISNDDTGRVNWVWLAPDGTVSNPRDIYYSEGPFTFPQTGTHQIRVTPTNDAIGTYSFRLVYMDE